MPKISSYNLKFAGNCIPVEIWYTSKEGYFFLKNHPRELNILGKFENGATSEKDLKNKAAEAVKIAEEQMESTELVLVVKFSVSDALYYNINELEQGGRSYTPNGDFPSKFAQDFGSTRDKGWGFSIDWEVCFRKTTGVDVKFWTAKEENGKFKQGNSKTIETKSRVIMLYTPERIAFFEAMGNATKSLAMKIGQFLGQDVDVLASMIEKGKSPMLNEKNEI